MKTFKDLTFKEIKGLNGIQAKEYFDNGYGVSIVKHIFSYGNEESLYEMAILKNDKLCYSTPITDDVMGHLTPENVTELLQKVQQLTKASNEG